MKVFLSVVCAWLGVWVGPARALGPHEVLVLINTNAPVSARVGETWARLRRVPERNVIHVGAPAPGGEPALSISPADFRRLIWEPARAEADKRGIAGHVLAWVYAPGFPWRVQTDPPVSLTGFTFLRGEPADTGTVRRGTFASPFYAGPHGPGAPLYSTRTLDVWTEWMGADRPVPGWALAHVGPRGLTEEQAGAMLIRGMDSDGTRPAGGICVVTNADIRSRTREWQWAGLAEELAACGIPAAFRDTPPSGGEPVWGLMMGAARVDAAAGVRFQPGALADHLTSFGAAFEEDGQSKCTVWLAGGAAAAGGAVTEPYAVWSKFPHARLFVHYAEGCTALESYYQSIQSPLQYLPMGDPLAAPWKPRGEVVLEGVERLARGGGLRISVRGGAGTAWHAWRVFVDGLPAGEGRLEDLFFWPAGMALAEVRELRVVVRSAGLVRHQVFTTRAGPFAGAGEESAR